MNFHGLDAAQRAISSTPLAQSPPFNEVLNDYMQNCSPDPAARIAAVTGIVLSFWQLKGYKLSDRVPSFLFVTPGSGPCPADELAGALVYDAWQEEPKIPDEGRYMNQDPSKAPDMMAKALKAHVKYAKEGNKNLASMCAEVFFDARKARWGDPRTRLFSSAWQEPFGFMTRKDNYVVLRLADMDDSDAFYDVLTNGTMRERLHDPMGTGTGLTLTWKSIALNGRLSQEQWSLDVADLIAEHPRLCLTIPCPDDIALEDKHHQIIKIYSSVWNSLPVARINTPTRMPGIDWETAARAEIHQRLSHLPMDYSFYLQETLRNLLEVCGRIASFAIRFSCLEDKTYTSHLIRLTQDLYAHSLLGLTASVMALSWHCIGFGTGCSRELATKVLDYLRKAGEATPRELLRGTPLKNAGERDSLIRVLAAEGLVETGQNLIKAVNYSSFVESIYKRQAITLPPLLCSMS